MGADCHLVIDRTAATRAMGEFISEPVKIGRRRTIRVEPLAQIPPAIFGQWGVIWVGLDRPAGHTCKDIQELGKDAVWMLR